MGEKTTLNNIDTSIEYIETLEKNVSAEIQLNFGSLITSHAHEKIQSCLAGLKSTAAKFRQLLQFGHEQLKSSAIKPRIKPWVDQLLSVNHVIDEVICNNKIQIHFHFFKNGIVRRVGGV